MATTKVIEIKPLNLVTAEITIEGDTDLILNKMNDVTYRKLTDERTGKSKKIEETNVWEEIITSMHWRDGKPKEFTEETLKDALKNNAPCITTFGLYTSFKEAVTRHEVAQYSTKFKSNMNVVSDGGLVPVTFAEHYIDEKLIQPKKGAPVLSRQNRFTGWTATFKVQFIEGGVYSLEQIVQIISLAGFGGGIGSGRELGFGRYHVADVKGA